jgi:hypothetical protein
MAARVSGYPGGYVERLAEPYNMDPGVYEPECDWQEDQQPAYPDTEQFLLDQFQVEINSEFFFFNVDKQQSKKSFKIHIRRL